MRLGLTRLSLTAAMLLASGCGRRACREPFGHEALFPYTGAWHAGDRADDLCLYQQDYRVVIGVYAGQEVSGIVESDGLLALGLPGRSGVDTWLVRKSADTLSADSVIRAGRGLEVVPRRRWRR